MGQDLYDRFGDVAQADNIKLRAALTELLACADQHVESGHVESLDMTNARAKARAVLKGDP